MSTLAELQKELASSQDDLDFLVKDALVDNPDDAETLAMKADLEQTIANLKAHIAAQTSAPPPPPPDAGAPLKYDMSKHPKFAKTSNDVPPPPPEDTRVTFKTGDTVQAKYSRDKHWYPAVIVGKTGSSADPVYTVNFTGYDERESKRQHEVRPVDKKRKADGPPAPAETTIIPPPPPPVATQNGTVISAASTVDPNLVPKREPSKVSDGPTRMAPAPKKLKGNRALESSKKSWNDFQINGPKKPVVGTKKMGKESQFRTTNSHKGKVGFTGSGKPMSKDPARIKWEYAQVDPEEE